MAKKFNPKIELTSKILNQLAECGLQTFREIAIATGIKLGDLRTHVDHLSRTGHIESVSVTRDRLCYKIAARGLSELEKVA